jgi:AmmeMemoRadiSam system protein B
MATRAAALAGTGWYPSGRAECLAAIEDLLDRAPVATVTGTMLGAVVPHAGWSFSGPTAAAGLRALSTEGAGRPLIVLGAVHRMPVDLPALGESDAWETPLGPLAVHAELSRAIAGLGDDLVRVDRDAHPPGENSIELQTPLIRALLPDASFVPVTVPPTSAAVPFGAALGRMLRESRLDAAVVASTDLTHYGYGGWSPAGTGREAVRWVREENDRRLLDRVIRLDAEGIVPEARERQSACGAGAVAAAVAAVREMGASEGVLLHQTTSYDVVPDFGADRFVGYAAVAFR